MIARCGYCGKFMNKGWIYTPWGTYEMTEPPEDEFICNKCFTPERKRFLDLMWHHPVDLGFRIRENGNG